MKTSIRVILVLVATYLAIVYLKWFWTSVYDQIKSWFLY